MRSDRRRAAVALVLALVLGGCTPAPLPSPTPVSPDGWQEHGPITLAVDSGLSGPLRPLVDAWNTSHPAEPATLLELPSRDGQRAPDLAERAKADSGEFTVVLLEPAVAPEFAANGWLSRLPASRFPTEGLDATAVASGTYQDELYAYPLSLDVGVLYYRGDILARYGVKPPTSWGELLAACAKVLGRPSSRSCYAGQLGPNPDLTANVAEAVWSAGGELVGSDGTPAVDSAAAAVGVSRIADAVSSAQVPAAALEWPGDQGRRELVDGSLVFLRDWWSARAAIAASGSAAARVGMTLVPGTIGPGVAVRSGRTLGVSAEARNKGTAADFIVYLTAAPQQRSLALASFGVPALTEVAADPGLVKALPALRTAGTAMATARPLPQTTRFTDVSRAVREVIAPVLKGDREVPDGLADLQQRLGDLFR
jgi:multiple sugar transport system substrate-binding protein